ncbi:hypothetical protein AB1Y20_002549 [Prymnesium parvum]|uniref:Uncharacterized protein n=1 Tax=Prymnesium parvum TaxID=97485 RepID=A0AB34JAQ9_PRYPA
MSKANWAFRIWVGRRHREQHILQQAVGRSDACSRLQPVVVAAGRASRGISFARWRRPAPRWRGGDTLVFAAAGTPVRVAVKKAQS